MEIKSRAARFQHSLSRINKGAAFISGILVVLIMLMTVYEVIGRYAFNSPTSWSIELSGYLFLISIFFAAAYTLEKKGHVKVDVIVDQVPVKIRHVVFIITAILAIIFCALLLWQTAKLTFDAYDLDWISNTPLKLTLFPIYLAMPVGCVLLFIQSISDLVLLFSNRKPA